VRFYDYNKARELIEQFKPVRATLGMREDWSWTAKDVYEDGRFIVDLFGGDIVKTNAECDAELAAALKDVTDGAARLDLLVSVQKKYGHALQGICGSCWATPSLRMEFADGAERHFECFIQSGEQSEPYVRPVLGCLSGPCQDAIECVPLESVQPSIQPTRELVGK